MKKFLALSALVLATSASAADDLSTQLGNVGLAAVSGVSAAITPIWIVMIGLAAGFAVVAMMKRAFK